MAKRTVVVIDSFSQVQAYKRARERDAAVATAKVKPASATNTDDNSSKLRTAVPGAATGVQSRVATSSLRSMPASTTAPKPREVTPLNPIGVTVVPKKRTITCYSCGYSFPATGKLHVPYCPKCKLLLCTDDIVIDGEQSSNVQTIGDVVIKSTAKLVDGITINGRSVTIGGDVSHCATVFASEQIVLETGAVFSPTVLEQTNVIIPAGAEIKVSSTLKCKRLTVMGKIEGAISVAECLEIKAGGNVVGDVSAPSLVMELGAGLTGSCKIIK